MIALTVNAQRVVEKQISVKPSASLDLKLDFADTIQIKQSKDNTLRIIATVSINDNQNNDKYELITSEGSDFIKVKAKIHDMESIRVPCKNRKGSRSEYRNGECLTMDINYIIEIPAIADFHIETISGDIIVDNAQSAMSIESISGFIDMSIPAKSNFDLKIKTITGGIYTNHEFSTNIDNFKGGPGGTDGWFKLGVGGNRVKLSTISGDIFLRKI